MLVISSTCESDSVNEDLFYGEVPDAFEQLEDGPEFNIHQSESDVFNPIRDQVVGKSYLIRTFSKIIGRYESYDLEPGHVYTLWWVVWNNPHACKIPGACENNDMGNAVSIDVEIMYAGGQVAESDGILSFTTHLNAGDPSRSINSMHGLAPAGGLQFGKTFSAEVHLILRSHGPAIPGMLNAQLRNYYGGCVSPSQILPNSEIPDQAGECANIEIAVHPPVS